jgi:hypothetical protein
MNNNPANNQNEKRQLQIILFVCNLIICTLAARVLAGSAWWMSALSGVIAAALIWGMHLLFPRLNPLRSDVDDDADEKPPQG